MCGRIRIIRIVKKKRRMAIHHPTAVGGDVIRIIRIIIIIVKKKRRIAIHHPTTVGVM